VKYLKTYENKIPMNLWGNVKNQEYDEVIQAIESGVDINSTIGQSKFTMLMTVRDCGMLDLLTELGADWCQRDSVGRDLIDHLESRGSDVSKKLLKYIKWKYPEKFKEHLTRKEADKYNI